MSLKLCQLDHWQKHKLDHLCIPAQKFGTAKMDIIKSAIFGH
jgi:hypothetical protein